ncbi:hypothetical protein TCSYLVIO_005362 [Trypanosoma cruzi]|nr:hypothetical protein TCSYLVIO_005362 [Trypanosoma cruzi]
MVTTTVRVLHWVAGNTTHLGPAVTLATEAVKGVTGLQHRLLNTATASNDTNHGAAVTGNGLLLPAWQLQACAASLVVVRDDDAVVARGTCYGAAVADLRLHVADDAALRDLAKRQHIANGEWCLHAAENGLSSEHALRRHHQLLHAAVLVRMPEFHAGERGTTAGLMLNRLDHTTHKTMTLGVVKNAELRGPETLVAVHLVDGPVALTAGEHSLSHRPFLFFPDCLFGPFCREQEDAAKERNR